MYCSRHATLLTLDVGVGQRWANYMWGVHWAITPPACMISWTASENLDARPRPQNRNIHRIKGLARPGLKRDSHTHLFSKIKKKNFQKIFHN